MRARKQQQLAAIHQQLQQHSPKKQGEDSAVNNNDWDDLFSQAIGLLKAKEQLAQKDQLGKEVEGKTDASPQNYLYWEFYRFAHSQLSSIRDFLDHEHVTDRMRLEVARNAMKYAQGFVAIKPGDELIEQLAVNEKISDLGKNFIKNSLEAMDPSLAESSRKLFYALLKGCFYIGSVLAVTTAVPVFFGASAATVLSYSAGAGMTLLIDYLNKVHEKQKIQAQEAKSEIKEGMRQVEQKTNTILQTKKNVSRSPGQL